MRECVTAKGEATTGRLMAIGVWVGGGPYWPTSYRWAYGWPFGRGYKPLTAEERAAVSAKATAYEGALNERCGN